jgi:hypothetical protein
VFRYVPGRGKAGAEALLAGYQVYFTELLTRLVNGWPNSRIDKLMPWRSAAAKGG